MLLEPSPRRHEHPRLYLSCENIVTQGYRVIYREAHILLEEIADAALDGKRKEHMELLATVPLLIIDDLGMRKLGTTFPESGLP